MGVNATIYKPNERELVVGNGGTLRVQTDALVNCGAAGARKISPHVAGAVVPSIGVSVEEEIFLWNRTKFTLTNFSQTITDATTNGAHGGTKIFDFPEGLLLIAGVVASATVARVGTNIGATATVLQALGTAVAATDNATLAGSGEGDILASNSATLSSGSGTWATQSSALVMSSGVSTARDLFFNSVIADADCSGNDALLYNGTIWMVWAIIGDR